MKNNNIVVTIATSILVTFLGVMVLTAHLNTAINQQSVPQNNLGGASPDFSNTNNLLVNGISTFYNTTGLKTGTTTTCAIQSPAATSSLLLNSGVRYAQGSTSAITVSVYKSATRFATTTLLFAENFASGVGGQATATTSNNNFIFAPLQWMVVGQTGGQNLAAGNCQAVFQTL